MPWALLVSFAFAADVLLHQPTVTGATAASDGRVALDGADWRAPGALVVKPDAPLVWALPDLTPLAGAALQADNNDVYLVEVSADGTTWRTWWRAPAVDEAGLQTRSDLELPPTQARFVRLTPSGGDGNYSVTELELFDHDTDGSSLLRPRWFPTAPLDRAWLGLLGLVAAFVFGVGRRTPPVVVGLVGALVAVVGGAVLWNTLFRSAVPNSGVTLIRAVVASFAGLAVAREAWTARPAHPVVTRVVLGCAAVLGLACFLNLGRPQFQDVGRHTPTFLHHYDMRTYYPIAKYFPELRFDGVYAASTAVVAEDQGFDTLAKRPLRDLRTHDLRTVGVLRDHITEVRDRFSPERWAEFRSDMGYFRRAMGDRGFLDSMNDHGGNATPVWFLAARALFAWTPASDGVLWAGVVLDILLVAGAFVAVWRSYGARTALLAMTLFGTVDFYWFTSNWFGAALRHDWLALWALALCALRVGRWRLAGGLLAWSALIRAFPALAFVTMAFPVLGDLFRRRGLGLRAWWADRADVRGVLAGAAWATLVLGGASVLVFGVSAWPEWLHKVHLLDKDPHFNNLALRTWFTKTTASWLPVALGSSVASAWLLRRHPLDQAAAWGVVLLPIVFNPANYYLHVAFVLVVLAGESPGRLPGRRGWLVWGVLCAMCVGSAFTYGTGSLPHHFKEDTVVLFLALAALTVLMVPGPVSSSPPPTPAEPTG